MRFAIGLTLGLALTAFVRDAGAYCRTGTCTPPATFIPTTGKCVPTGFTSCDNGGETIKNVPLFWKSSCVGYSVQKDAGKKVTLDQATAAMSGAFAAWASADCPGAPSMQGKDLGPVACGDASFNLDAANQHVVVFRDAGWPHKTADEIRLNQPSPTVALTTVSFDTQTGEILDADIELNTADHTIIVTDTPSAGVFDLESVLTHESGHFLGLAHSPETTSVMYYQDEGGSSKHRAIGADDAAAICAVYPPNGKRPVDTQTDPSGFVATTGCDPTPRGGQTSACTGDTTSGGTPTTTTSRGCAAAPSARAADRIGALSVALAALLFGARRRRRVG